MSPATVLKPGMPDIEPARHADERCHVVPAVQALRHQFTAGAPGRAVDEPWRMVRSS